MQLRLSGMEGDPVRVSVDLTWWPNDDTFQVSSRTWMKEAGEPSWRLEGMTVYPCERYSDVPEMLSQALTDAWALVGNLSGIQHPG